MKRISLNEVKNDNYAKLYKFLFDGEFIKMSDSAKILYCLLRDRMQLSIKKVSEGQNYWVDKNGDIFIHATVDNIMELIQCGKEKATKLKKELIKFNLIEDIRVGNNKPNKIYILNVNYLESLDNSLKFENRNTGSSKTETPEVRKSKPNKTDKNKTEKNKTDNNNTIKIAKKIIAMADEIENILKCSVNVEVLNSTIKKNNLLLDDIRHYLSNWHKFDYKTKDNPIAFLLHLVKIKAEIPKAKKGFTKPEQSTNFEQRIYSDEYFDSLYENFR